MDKNTQLKDIAWGEIPRKKLPCWDYGNDGNTVVRKYYELYPLCELGIPEWKVADFALSVNDWDIVSVWQRVGERYQIIPFKWYVNEKTVNDIETVIEKYPYRGLDGWRRFISDVRKNNNFLKSIWMMPLTKEEKVLCEKYRQNWMREKEEAERAKAVEEERRRAAEEDEQKRAEAARLEENVNKAVTIIRNGGDFVNFDGTLVLELAKRAGITVPLRSNGWIQKWLYAVGVKNGKVTHTRLNGKGTKTSDSMFALLDKIVAYHYH